MLPNVFKAAGNETQWYTMTEQHINFDWGAYLNDWTFSIFCNDCIDFRDHFLGYSLFIILWNGLKMSEYEA